MKWSAYDTQEKVLARPTSVPGIGGPPDIKHSLRQTTLVPLRDPQRNRGQAMTSLNLVLVEAASTGSSGKCFRADARIAENIFAASKDQT